MDGLTAEPAEGVCLTMRPGPRPKGKPATEPQLIVGEVAHEANAKVVAERTAFIAGAWPVANDEARRRGCT